MTVKSRRYEQYCPVARSLDLLGERWTLLIVRDLMMGPQRYSDLREGLPGIATDLLTARLRTLEEAGYLERRQLPRPASVTVYDLTEAGHRLALIILELGRAGLPRLGPPADGEDISPDALVLSLRASFRPELSKQEQADYGVVLDGEPFTVRTQPGWAEAYRGKPDDPKLTIATTARTFARVISGAVEAKAAVAAGDLELHGPRAALDRFFAMFAYPVKG